MTLLPDEELNVLIQFAMLTLLHSLFVFVYIVVVIVFASFVDTWSYVHTLIFFYCMTCYVAVSL